LSDEEYVLKDYSNRPMTLVEFPDANVISCRLHKTTASVYNHVLLNRNHEFVLWLLRVKSACENEEHGLSKEQFKQTVSLLETPLWFGGHECEKLRLYLQGWRDLGGLPSELQSPNVDLQRSRFLRLVPD
jgi:hypothetical protein